MKKLAHPTAAIGCKSLAKENKIYSLQGVNNYTLNSALKHNIRQCSVSNVIDDFSKVRWFFYLLKKYAKMAGRPFPEVALEYLVLLYPQPTETDIVGNIRYLECLSKLYRNLAFYEESPVFESKENQRKLLILSYFSKRDCAKSSDLSSDLKMPLTNASERLRRYYKQGLLSREAVESKRRGRRIMVYMLTEAGRRRLAFLEKTVKFRRAETDRSKRYRSHQLEAEMTLKALRRRLGSL